MVPAQSKNMDQVRKISIFIYPLLRQRLNHILTLLSASLTKILFSGLLNDLKVQL